MAIDPVTDEAFLCVSGPCEPGKGGVYRSCDKGLTWSWCSKGLPGGQSLFKDTEFGPCWKPELVFGFDGSLLCVSSKLGKTWRFERETLSWHLAPPLNPSNAGSLVADPFRPGRFFFSGGVLGESLDGGRTFAWKDWLRSACGRHLAFDEHVKDLFVTLTDGAILVSRDGRAHYSVIDDGLRDLPSGACAVRFSLIAGGSFSSPKDAVSGSSSCKWRCRSGVCLSDDEPGAGGRQAGAERRQSVVRQSDRDRDRFR